MPLADRKNAGEAKERRLIRISGIVQGVGFRPFVYNLAVRHNLTGWVRNNSDGVCIDVEGPAADIAAFLATLRSSPPPLAQITRIGVETAPPVGYDKFTIVASEELPAKHVLVSPDVATCADCLADIADPRNRRWRYPFTNCTNCGPRYTIIQDVPYDRPSTSMAGFPMCAACRDEYDRPTDRRFHAQPNACPDCGPQVTVTDGHGRPLPGAWDDTFRDLIRAGKIVAVKGIGGFHLACDAANPAAVAELRRRKRRPAKPLAIMARDMAVVRELCRVSDREAAILESPAAPIVLLDRRERTPALEMLAPRLSRLGVMLPYTPLHHLLFDADLKTIVLTSGNRRGLPLARTNAAAYAELGDVADFFLVHDREIVNRCDDSVLRVFDGVEYFFRRSRGYTPRPVALPFAADSPVLAVGSDMKNTFCLLREENAFPGPHIGDIDNRETEQHFLASLAAMTRILGVNPDLVACDLHPGYNTTRLAETLAAGRLCRVQHHHAHLASCLAENGLTGPVIGVVCDGTGYGTDGNLWGMEILHGDYLDFHRACHLAYLPLPGGEIAVRQPWRMAASYAAAYLDNPENALASLFPEYGDKLPAVLSLARSGFNSPRTASCGRLFDAVSALLGVCRETSYEGQAAIELEAAAAAGTATPYPYDIVGDIMQPDRLFRAVYDDLSRGVDRADIAARFHRTVAAMLSDAVRQTADKTGLRQVVLSGGVFQNELLLRDLTASLRQAGLEVYRHRLVPPGDGGIALGQAVIAAARAKKGLI